MTQQFHYVLPVGQTEWTIEGAAQTVLRWDYDSGRGELLALHNKAKAHQWDAASRIDWSQDLDAENPSGLDDRAIAIHGSDMWNRMTAGERANLRRHLQAWQISQFLHGEQGALVCAAKLVQQMPDVDAKYLPPPRRWMRRGMWKPFPGCCGRSSPWPIRSPRRSRHC